MGFHLAGLRDLKISESQSRSPELDSLGPQPFDPKASNAP